MFGTNLTIKLPADTSTCEGSVISSKSIRIKSNKPYPAYPILNWQSDSYRIVWEGHCYTGKEQFHQLFLALQVALQQESIVAITEIINTIQESSGEFACWMIGKQGLFFFNDALGRLPIYNYKDGQCFFIGRDLHAFFQEQNRVPDRMGVAQTMWCGYALGKKTLFEGVERVSGGTRMYFSFENAQLSKHVDFPFDFTKRNCISLKENAEALTKSFKQACRKITNSLEGGFHLSLSGGQDSRAVLAGFQQAGASLTASSFSLSESDSDANTAALLAKKLNVPWQSFRIDATNNSDDWLIQLKCGLNYSGMAFIESYLKKIAALQPGSLLLTGDGGDKLLPFLGEAIQPTSAAHLVSLLLKRHAILKAGIAVKVCGLHLDDLQQSLHERICEYPEQSLMDKSIHFTLFERGAKAYFEGEDRNRFFMWSTTPFYDLDFFNVAMAVPDSYKKNYKLYRHFMKYVAPELMDIPDAGGGTINSNQFITRKWVQEQFRSAPYFIKWPLRLLQQGLQSSSFVKKPVLIPSEIPASLHFLQANHFGNLVQNGGAEAALHLRTILKTFA